ncbi:MAG TPA: 30S ribosomal protein S6 [Defluviitaleaceae bacterium]|jgi:small subunit ribosomal protein S6|nr:30S ribosomal protein S6 [Candidatus Epulonipiscium sp.]HOA81492.1 30S ribosomal protein S6 [Defluviitaleaceae bacterium]
MKKYELAVVFMPNLDEEAKAAQLEKVQKYITRFGGTVDNVDDWGKRKLAYEIDKINEGYYYFIDFTADSSAPVEIESRIRIMDSVIRYLIIAKED